MLLQFIVLSNGIAERFVRTLTEQCLYLHRCHDLKEARARIAKFIETYSADWRLGRLGYRSPLEATSDYRASEATQGC